MDFGLRGGPGTSPGCIRGTTVVKLLGSQSYTQIFDCVGVGAPKLTLALFTGPL